MRSCRSTPPREVDPPRASVHAASVVGAAAAGGVPVDADGPAAARSVRPTLPSRVSRPKPRDPVCKSTLAGKPPKTDADLRAALLASSATSPTGTTPSHPRLSGDWPRPGEAAHPDETPLVVDPFAGRGSIPLEALRLGCDTFASDLNPVACLISKVLLEDIPHHGPELAEELRRIGAEVKKAAEGELAEFYPVDHDGARPIAYLWARTVRCEAPNCGAEIPLLRSFWLCKKAKRRRALRPRVVRKDGQVPRVEFELFVPKTESEVEPGHATGGKARYPACPAVLSGQRVRSQLVLERGGGSPRLSTNGERIGGARLIAVVTTTNERSGRTYRLPEKRDYKACFLASQQPLSNLPTE